MTADPSRRDGKARVIVRNLRGPEADIDAQTWAALAETPACGQPADLTATAEWFGVTGGAPAFAHAAKPRGPWRPSATTRAGGPPVMTRSAAA